MWISLVILFRSFVFSKLHFPLDFGGFRTLVLCCTILFSHIQQCQRFKCQLNCFVFTFFLQEMHELPNAQQYLTSIMKSGSFLVGSVFGKGWNLFATQGECISLYTDYTVMELGANYTSQSPSASESASTSECSADRKVPIGLCVSSYIYQSVLVLSTDIPPHPNITKLYLFYIWIRAVLVL